MRVSALVSFCDFFMGMSLAGYRMPNVGYLKDHVRMPDVSSGQRVIYAEVVHSRYGNSGWTDEVGRAVGRKPHDISLGRFTNDGTCPLSDCVDSNRSATFVVAASFICIIIRSGHGK